jgi:hypothetical protein
MQLCQVNPLPEPGDLAPSPVLNDTASGKRRVGARVSLRWLQAAGSGDGW